MKNKKLAFGVLILAFIFLAVGAGMLYSDFQTRNRAEQQYESLAELARETTAPETEASTTEAETSAAYASPIDFEKLKKINPDIVGWIRIEGTAIDYPIVQTDNNETYLDTDFEGKKSVAGAIYLDYESEPDFSGRHNIIYGHHMKNGTMFKDIIKYKDESFFKEHQDIFIYTPEREYHLRPVTALYTDASAIRRKTVFETEESFQAYVEEMTKQGRFLQKPEEPVKQLWSFVTCSYEFNDARTILYACEVPQEEN
ncbi:class B sortase [Lacrimispora brassicae]